MFKTGYGTENVEEEGYGSRPRLYFRKTFWDQEDKDRIQTNFYWPDMQAVVTSFCRSWDICQKTTAKGSVPRVPLGDMLLIVMPFRRIAVDLVGPISPKSEKGHRYILTLVDYATRYPEASPPVASSR